MTNYITLKLRLPAPFPDTFCNSALRSNCFHLRLDSLLGILFEICVFPRHYHHKPILLISSPLNCYASKIDYGVLSDSEIAKVSILLG